MHRLPLIPFSLGHYSLPELCFPYPLQGLHNPLSMPCLPLCLLYQLQGVVADTVPFLIVQRILRAILAHPHCLFLASVGFPLPLASFCLLPYLSMKQFSSIFLPLSSTRSTKGSVKNKLFVTVPDSRINSWESWFIFNLRKINTSQYYKSDSLNARNCNTIRGCMTLQDDKCIIITVHT